LPETTEGRSVLQAALAPVHLSGNFGTPPEIGSPVG
jgi:hypothetical protein